MEDGPAPSHCHDRWSLTHIGPGQTAAGLRVPPRGHRNLFLACEPLAGWRQVAVTQRRTMQDSTLWWMKPPEVPVVRLVRHPPRGVAVRDVPGCEARRIAKRLEFHYTPKHGSWLNMAEIEFSVLSRSCLERLPDEQALRRETQATGRERNAAHWYQLGSKPKRPIQTSPPLPF